MLGIISIFWNFTGNIAFNWFYLSSLGAALGLLQRNRLIAEEYNKQESESKDGDYRYGN